MQFDLDTNEFWRVNELIFRIHVKAMKLSDALQYVKLDDAMGRNGIAKDPYQKTVPTADRSNHSSARS